MNNQPVTVEQLMQAVSMVGQPVTRHSVSAISENDSRTSRKVLEPVDKRAEIHRRFLGLFYEDRNYPNREELAAGVGN